MNPYPLPSYAVSVWVVGDSLMVAFPGQGPEGQGHTIKLPASTAGFSIALQMLNERQHAQDLRLNMPGTPTQYEIESIKRHRANLVDRRIVLAQHKARREKEEADRIERALKRNRAAQAKAKEQAQQDRWLESVIGDLL